MKVYVVKNPSGVYEDYSEDIIGVYSDYSRVETMVKERELIVNQQEEQTRECRQCRFNKIPKDFANDIQKPECFEAFSNCSDKYLSCKCKDLRKAEWGDINPNWCKSQELIVEEYELDGE